MINLLEDYILNNWECFEKNQKKPGLVSFIKLNGQRSDNAALNFALFVDDDDAPKYFIKVNRLTNDFRQIKNEFDNLINVERTIPPRLKDSFPKPIYFGDMEKSTKVMIESFVSGKKIYLGDIAKLEILLKKSFEWLKEFYSATKRDKTLTFDLSGIKKRYYELRSGSVSKELDPKFEKVMKEFSNIDKRSVNISASQGDFDFDNIVFDNGSPKILDWEDFKSDSHPFLDAEFMIFNTALYFYRNVEHIESFKKFFSVNSNTRVIAESYLTDYCKFLGVNIGLFLVAAINDTLDFLDKGYGNHLKVPMQSWDFFECLLDLALEMRADGPK